MPSVSLWCRLQDWSWLEWLALKCLHSMAVDTSCRNTGRKPNERDAHVCVWCACGVCVCTHTCMGCVVVVHVCIYVCVCLCMCVVCVHTHVYGVCGGGACVHLCICVVCGWVHMCAFVYVWGICILEGRQLQRRSRGNLDHVGSELARKHCSLPANTHRGSAKLSQGS